MANDLVPISSEAKATGGTLLPGASLLYRAANHLPPRKNLPFPSASVRSLRGVPSRNEPIRNPAFPDTPPTSRPTVKRANSCSIPSHEAPLSSLPTRARGAPYIPESIPVSPAARSRYVAHILLKAQIENGKCINQEFFWKG